MTSMTVGKDRIDLLQDRIEALEKKLADQDRAKDVQDNYGWVYGVPMTDGLGNHSICEIKPIICESTPAIAQSKSKTE